MSENLPRIPKWNEMDVIIWRSGIARDMARAAGISTDAARNIIQEASKEAETRHEQFLAIVQRRIAELKAGQS